MEREYRNGASGHSTFISHNPHRAFPIQPEHPRILPTNNAAGPGQALDEDTRAAIQSIQKPIKLELLVSLSCTMCPELVTAAQRIAAENPHITAQVYDLNRFPDLREKYQVMSVPCLVINDGEQVSFGKKNIRQLLELLA